MPQQSTRRWRAETNRAAAPGTRRHDDPVQRRTAPPRRETPRDEIGSSRNTRGAPEHDSHHRAPECKPLSRGVAAAQRDELPQILLAIFVRRPHIGKVVVHELETTK